MSCMFGGLNIPIYLILKLLVRSISIQKNYFVCINICIFIYIYIYIYIYTYINIYKYYRTDAEVAGEADIDLKELKDPQTDADRAPDPKW
jgi:hypothetical protein